MSNWFSDLGKKIKKVFKKASNSILSGSAIYGGLTGDIAGTIAGFGLGGTTKFFGEVPDSELYKMMEGYIPGTNINPIDRYLGRDIAQQNFQYQKDAYEYQKWLNEQQMTREDSAYQRKLNDMVSAGFNPILASGGSGESTSPLRAGSAPQMADTSGALREGVGQALSILTGFAGLKKMKAETSLLKSQADYQDIVNAHEDEYLGARNSGMILDNQLKDGTLQSKIRKSIQEVDINDRKILIMDLEKMLKSKDIDLKDIEIDIQKLIKEGKLTEIQILDKKLELLSTKVLRECLDYENELWDTEWYHKNYHLPKGFNPGWIGALGMFLGGLGGASVDHILNFFGGFIDSGNSPSSNDKPYKLSKKEIRQLLRRPSGTTHLTNMKMINKEDYGVRRNF